MQADKQSDCIKARADNSQSNINDASFNVNEEFISTFFIGLGSSNEYIYPNFRTQTQLTQSI